MKLTDEQKIGLILLVIGMFVSVSQQREIQSHILTACGTPTEPLLVGCPVDLIYKQMAGMMILIAGATILIRSIIYERSQRRE